MCPPIYTKLLDVDKVDLINSGYATPIIAAALPIAMQHDMVLMGLFGLANNAKLNYDKYFGMAPIGEDPANVATKPFFDAAEHAQPEAVDDRGHHARHSVRPCRSRRRAQRREGPRNEDRL